MTLTGASAPRSLALDWLVSAAQELGDGCYALTLVRGREDATAVVTLSRRATLAVEACIDPAAREWLESSDGDFAVFAAIYGNAYAQRVAS